jgi:hypothetical protein
MTEEPFEYSTILERVGQLEAGRQVLYAAMCSQRLLGALVLFSERTGESQLVKDAATIAASYWEVALRHTSRSLVRSEPSPLIDKLAKHEQRFPLECAFAENALLALAYTNRCIGGAPSAAVGAARCGLDIADLAAATHLRINTTIDEKVEREIAETDVMLFERSVQTADLRDLGAPSGVSTDLVVSMRRRSSEASETLHDLLVRFSSSG